MVRRTLLSEEEIAARLREIPQWKREGKSITQTWKFREFPEALAFINKVGASAESMNHHPDIYNSWATVRLTLTTHDRGGLTNLDFDLAKQIDALSAIPRRRSRDHGPGPRSATTRAKNR
ncbi:MAG: 4a-hydroxytetrahydrobiopterin dehydratase [Thermoplasmata archaeon]